MSSAATLYLIPSTLGAGASAAALPEATLATLRSLRYLVVETPKQARRFLTECGIRFGMGELRIDVLDEHTADSRLDELLAPALAGSDVGVLSDAGCPGVADPGARLVRLAHRHGIRVAPLVGPSAILLALMASGLDGQRFRFHGYLPVDAARRNEALRALEQAARRSGETQILIEAPYRNNRLLQAVLSVCRPDTLLCVCADLTLPSEFVATQTVARWRDARPDLDRRPAVFLLGFDAPAKRTFAPAGKLPLKRRS